MKSLITFLTLACLLTACHSGKKFTSRKYTSGRYVSHATHKQRISKNTSEKETSVVIQKAIQKETESVVLVEPVKEIVTASSNMPSGKATENGNRYKRISEKTKTLLEKNVIFQVISNKTFKKLEYKKSKEAAQPGTKSLLSVFLSGAGFILNIVGFLMALVFEEYIFLALLGIGLALGIVGLVLGIQGMKEYRTEKANGNKNKATLILGIIGTSIGGATIFAAIYFCVLGLLLLSFA